MSTWLRNTQYSVETDFWGNVQVDFRIFFKNSCFLEIRLLTNGRRVATIMAVTICSLYSLDVDDFKLGIGILVTSSDFSDFWGRIMGRKVSTISTAQYVMKHM